MTILRRAALAAALALLAGAAPAAAANRSTDTDFEHSWTLARGKSLQVRGINGSMVVRAAAGREARVVAVKEGKRDDPADVRIEFVEDATGVVVCALYPSRHGRYECGRKEERGAEDCDVEVEWTVEVPEGVRFIGETVNGGVKATGLASPVELITVNGSIDVETKSWASARTVNGSITASIGAASWKESVEFETVNGGIELELPRAVAAELDGTFMNGSVESDFPVTVRGKHGPRRVEGVFGAGGSPLSMFTINGNFVLRRRT